MFPSRDRLSKTFMWLIAALATLCAPPGGSQAAVEPSEASVQALSLLHQGRFDQASEAFRVVSRTRPEDPEGPLFEALTVWWRLMDLPDDPALRPILDERLVEAIRRGEALLEGPQAQRGRILGGTAALLAAQAQAFTGSYLKAGRSARRGHDLLEEALRVDPSASDALFALGAYKYFAARLPWLVRFLRVFVRLPGGDVEEGLEALADASSTGLYFRTESMLLLAYIYSGEDEDDLRTALFHLRRARRLGAESPLLATIEARFLFRMGRLGEAERNSVAAIKSSGMVPGVAPAIPAMATLDMALSLYYQYRPLEAAEALDHLHDTRGALPEDALSRLEGLKARLRKDSHTGHGDPEPGSGTRSSEAPRVRLAAAAPLPRGSGAQKAMADLRAGRPAAAAARFEALLLEADGEDPVIRYHLARAWQIAGDHERARKELTHLLRLRRKIPKTLRGWALIRMGVAFEESGMEAEARTFYRRAASLKGFVFRRAGQDRLRYPTASFFPEG